ncbi:MAG: hypothetical protein J5563_02460 [Clostridia bacterium]|nr:hypothetical protein [Clostridia bacterium]
MDKRFAAVALAFMLIISNVFLAAVSAAADEVSVNFNLKNPITVTAEGSELGDAEREELGRRIQSITQTAIDAFAADLPGIKFWTDPARSSFSYSYSIQELSGAVTCTVKNVNGRIAVGKSYYDPKGMSRALESVISGFEPDGTTMLEKVRSIHDFVAGRTVYDKKAEWCYSPFGALVGGRAVCEGYAEAFKMLCDYNGIPCVCVSGVGNSENHMWNCVRMDDGKWYAVDVTWDDQTKISYSYFLVGSTTVVTGSKTFSQNHTPNGDLSLTGYKTFDYPVLSETKYVDSGRAFKAQEPADSWFYDQLDDEQKNFYDRLASMDPPEGSPAFVYENEDTTETDKVTEPPVVTESESTRPVTTPGTETEPRTEHVTDVPPEPGQSSADTTSEEAFSGGADTDGPETETSETLETSNTSDTSENDDSQNVSAPPEGTDIAGDGETSGESGQSSGASSTVQAPAGDTPSGISREQLKKYLSYGLNVVVVAVSLVLVLCIIVVIVYRFALKERGKK